MMPWSIIFGESLLYWRNAFGWGLHWYFSRVSFLLPGCKYVEKKIAYFVFFNVHIRVGILHLCANQ